ncbi:MAG: hypothetical protein FWH46_03040 [Methanimicrococcus sp.]|nr:hypothetical protein [Methanimicrococcus sp.]
MKASKTVGRITLVLESQDVGSDLFVTLTGGQAHIGAAALGTYDSVSHHTTVSVLCAPGHKEEQIALFGARSFSKALQKTVLFSVGIHLDQITSEEIQSIEQACHDLILENIAFIK